jgi:hypothetical protein
MEQNQFTRVNQKIRYLFVAFGLAFLIPIITGCTLTVPYPSPIPCGDTQELIKAIDFANTDPTTLDVIELDAGCNYQLNTYHDKTTGFSGLPSITTPIRILGHGSTISRVGDPNDPKFRILHVAFSGDLDLHETRLINGYAHDPTDTITVIKNSGGAILNSGTLTLTLVTIEKNTAYGVTGGVFNEGDLKIKHSIFRNNEQDANIYTMGGATAIHNRAWATTEMVGTTVNNNGLNGIWNAISNDENGTVYIENSTIDGNTGYGINNDGNLDLMYVTITDNGQGIWSVWYGIPKVRMTGTLFNNPYDCTIGSGVLILNHYNMDSDGTCGVMYTVSPAAMMLGPLANNGGVNQTRALLPGSPAIDAVTGPASRVCPIPEDQRSVSRPQHAYCDIGAYEYEGSLLQPAQVPDDLPAPLFTPTPTPPAAALRCDLFEIEGADLTMFDIPFGTANLSLFVEWPHPLWGLEEPVEGDDDEWQYSAVLGDTPASKCSYQGYSGRLYCDFRLEETDYGKALPLEVRVNLCPELIYYHPRVSIIEPEAPPPACHEDLSREACGEQGGVFNGRTSKCDCP